MPQKNNPSEKIEKNTKRNEKFDIFKSNKLGVPFNPKLYWEKAQDCYLKIVTDIAHGSNLSSVPKFLKSRTSNFLLDRTQKYDPANAGQLSAARNCIEMFPDFAASAVSHPAFQIAMQNPTKVAFYTAGIMGVVNGVKELSRHKNKELKGTSTNGAKQIQRTSATTQSVPDHAAKDQKKGKQMENKVKKENSKQTKQKDNTQIQRVSASSKNKKLRSYDKGENNQQELSKDIMSSISSKQTTKVLAKKDSGKKKTAGTVNTIQRTSAVAQSSNKKTSKEETQTKKKETSKGNSYSNGLNM
ncbi:MAG: hypothetical protein BA863_07685 [Desulfovibrio sp. S3730MH75]|nr:MAG: hypothetical protein BA863_07685 [Desulfovibrio sp. S3730MH75]